MDLSMQQMGRVWCAVRRYDAAKKWMFGEQRRQSILMRFLIAQFITTTSETLSYPLDTVSTHARYLFPTALLSPPIFSPLLAHTLHPTAKIANLVFHIIHPSLVGTGA